MSKEKHRNNKTGILSNISREEINKINGNILNFCAVSPELKTHSEINNYRLIFANYKYSICELHKFNDASLTKSLIERLGIITKYSGRNFSSSGLLQPAIKYTKEYKDLYNSIPPDTSLYHIDLGSTARLFYYTIANFFCIVAITYNHR